MPKSTLKMNTPGGLSEQLEKQLLKRDLGLATRFLYHEPGIPPEVLDLKLKKLFNLKKANSIAGGQYHNLKDLMAFPVNVSKIIKPKLAKNLYNTDVN